jgi:hypothetical protein
VKGILLLYKADAEAMHEATTGDAVAIGLAMTMAVAQQPLQSIADTDVLMAVSDNEASVDSMIPGTDVQPIADMSSLYGDERAQDLEGTPEQFDKAAALLDDNLLDAFLTMQDIAPLDGGMLDSQAMDSATSQPVVVGGVVIDEFAEMREPEAEQLGTIISDVIEVGGIVL